MVWINQINQPTKQLVLAVKKSAKGLILITAKYDCFLYESNQTAKFILEALEAWCAEDNWGVELWIQPNPKTKLGFEVIPGKELLYFPGTNYWGITEPELEQNPFLVRGSKEKPNKPTNPLMDQKRARAKQAAKNLDLTSHQEPLEASAS